MEKYFVGNMTRVEFIEALKNASGVILPVGSCEQHGYHLPLDTDNLQGFEMSLDIAKRTNMLVMPCINYGQIFSAHKIKGTFGLSENTLVDLLKEITIDLEKQGAKNVLYFTGHGGNKSAMKQAARELLIENDYHNVWYFSPQITEEMKQLLKGKPCKIPHAGEIETASMLYLHEELVQLDKVKDVYPVFPADFKYRPYTWDEFNEVGSFGASSIVTKEIGKKIYELSIDNMVSLIKEMIGEIHE